MVPPEPGYNRGDMVLVLYPNPDLRTAKTRLALIVQADNLQTGLPQVIVAMITSRLFRANHPSHVVLMVSTPAGQHWGFLADSVVMTDNLATVAEVAIDRVIGTLPWRTSIPLYGIHCSSRPSFMAVRTEHML
jgi:mRNA interferase MazF